MLVCPGHTSGHSPSLHTGHSLRSCVASRFGGRRAPHFGASWADCQPAKFLFRGGSIVSMVSRMTDHVSEGSGGSRRWVARPLQGWSVRGFVVLAPLAGSFAFVRFAATQLRPPTGSLWLYLLWWF